MLRRTKVILAGLIFIVFPTRAQIAANVNKWWTSTDIEAVQNSQAGKILDRFNFIRSAPDIQPMYIGTGELGGFIDGLGSNTDIYADADKMKNGYNLKLGFQAYDMFNPAYPWNSDRDIWGKGNKDYFFVKSRTSVLRFIVQPYINRGFDTALISNYKQTQSLWNSEIVTEFSYDQQVQFVIRTIASHVRVRLVMISVTVRNNGATPVICYVNKKISDSFTAGMLANKFLTLRTKEKIQVGIADGYYSRIKAACNWPGDTVKLMPGKEITDYTYFSITTDKTGIDAEDVIREALATGFHQLREEHQAYVHKKWNSSILFIPDWNLQRMYFQAINFAFSSVSGKYYPMGASFLGGAGWSGASYTYDGSFALSALLRTNNPERIEPVLNKLIIDILQSNRKFINFAFDENCTEGCGRYNNELHETAAMGFPLYLMLQYGKMRHDQEFLVHKVYPVFKQMSLYLAESLKLKDNLYYKDPEYVRDGDTFIMRSIESDRRRRWFTDLAIFYKDLLLQTVEIGKNIAGEKDTAMLDKLTDTADKIFIPQTPEYYQMYAGDNFPDTPKDGWGHMRWSFHTASVGAYPGSLLMGDKKCENSLKYIYGEGRKDLYTQCGAYPFIHHLASLRLRMLDFAEKCFYDTSFIYYGQKLNLATGNSILDTDNFLMSFTALATIIHEMLLDIHDETIRPFAALLPSHEKEGAFFKNLVALNGVIVSGLYEKGTKWIELNNPYNQLLKVEIPSKWGKVIVTDNHDNKVKFNTTKETGRRNCKNTILTIISFDGKAGNIYKITGM